MLLILILIFIFVLYESLKGITGTANQAPATPLGVSNLITGDDAGQLPVLTNVYEIDNSPLDIGGENIIVITNDVSTWPTGDRVWDICRAIAIAEGANVAGSNPDKLNNPGDISDGASTYGSQLHSGSNITTFPDKETGWAWLYRKINNSLNGNSTVFKPSMTWIQFAQKYSGNWQAWVTNVTNQLGVSPNDIVGSYGE